MRSQRAATVRRTTRLAAAADEFPRETARAAYSRFDDVCADEECDARELADDNGWDELRRLARREEAQDRAAAEKAAIAAFRARLEERWREAPWAVPCTSSIPKFNIVQGVSTRRRN